MTVFKPGDLVVLRSGGPVMTVDTVNTDIFDDNRITGVLCAWFVGNKLERARFDLAALVPAQAEEASADTQDTLPTEAGGEYSLVLDEMVVALNEAAEALDDASRPVVEKAKRTPAKKYAADAAAPAARRPN